LICYSLKKGEKLSYNHIKHRINTTDRIPVYTKQYKYPQVYKKEIDKQVSELLEKDVINKSFSPWSSPIRIVPKKNRRFQRKEIPYGNRLSETKFENNR